MKREIKFRVWDKNERQMYPLVDFNQTWISVPVMDEDGGHLEQRKKDDVELMQYTGLKDKSGKEIYEGDVVKFTEKCCDNAYSSFVINWDDISASFVCSDFKGRYYRWLSSMKPDTHFSVKYESKKIIGNIYENPELLNPPTK